MSRHFSVLLIALAAWLALTLTGCGGEAAETTGEAGPATGGAAGRIAAVFSGPVTDADYNALGLLALQAAEEQGAEIAYSESVAVPDAERVIQEYVADGFDVVWTHGSQFYEATATVASDSPDTTFIGEFDGEPEGQPDNVWVMDRNFHLGFYAVGVLASELSDSGTIGYVGGLSLPFSYSEVHAMRQAISDAGADATINAVWTGDFNDPAQAEQITSQLLSQGADVIVGSLNLGAVGIFQALEDSPQGETWATAKYTDKSELGGAHYAGSVIYDFTKPLTDVLASIAGGERSGYYALGFDTGVEIQPGENVPSEVQSVVSETVAGIQDGSITVERDTSPIE